MPPVRTKTSVGIETPQQTLDRARTMLTSSRASLAPTTSAAPSTPSTGFRVSVPESIPSTALNGDTSTTDLFSRRNEMEQATNLRNELTGGYDALMTRIGTVSSPLLDPEGTINRLLLNRPTDTQTSLDQARADQARTTRGFVSDLERTGEQAREQFGVADLQSSLAETRNRIAERTTSLRQTLRDFEVNAERRGVAREFVQAEKQKVQADAAAELADLAIIESAQLGNLNEARSEIDRVLEQKVQAFEFENQAIEQEIARLQAMDTREADARSEQLQIALTERKRNIEQQLANEKETREYMAQAAANGADQGTLDAIRNAKTPSEAAMVAGPWIGRLDRMQAEASIANTYSQIADREERLQLAREAAELDTETALAAGMTENEAEAEKALGMFAMLNELATHPGFGAAVGPNALARGLSPTGAFSAFVTGDRSNFISLADQIANTLTLDNMDKLKGPATDRDVELVANSVSKLKNRDMSQSDYGKEIQRIAAAMKRIAINKGATAEQLQFYGMADQQTLTEFDSRWNNTQTTPAIQINTNF